METEPEILISAVIVVKDNVEFLPECLKSLKGIVDELRIGNISGDISKFIKPIEFNGSDYEIWSLENGENKSDCLNTLISKANGKFILIIEPEERLILTPRKANNDPNGTVTATVANQEFTEEQKIAEFRKDVANTPDNVAGLYLTVLSKKNVGNDSYMQGVMQELKLFRDDGYIFEGYAIPRIQESIFVNKKIAIPYPYLAVQNIGFMNFERNVEQTNETLKTLDLEIEETENWRAYMNRAILKVAIGNKFGAISDYINAEIRCPYDDMTSRVILYNNGIQIYLMAQEPLKANECATKSLNKAPFQVYPYFQKGLIEYQYKRIHYARQNFEIALKNAQQLAQQGLMDVEFPIFPEQIMSVLNQINGKMPQTPGNIIIN